MVICKVVVARKRTLIIGAYLPTYTLEKSPDLEEALTRFRDQDNMVQGDLNVDVVQSQKPRSQRVADLLMKFGLVELLTHFWKCLRFRHMKTWYQVQILDCCGKDVTTSWGQIGTASKWRE